MSFFSIIVPIYNIERYIEKCIDSILSQTFTDFEIILVDDGSKDKSSEICDRIADKNNNVKVIHKKNGGLSAARNTGLKEATGQYVIFVDGDDSLCDDQALKKIKRVIDQSDYEVISYNRKVIDDRTGEISECKDYRKEEDNKLPFYDMIEKLIKTDCFYGSAWIFAIKKDYLINKDITFLEGTETEDLDWIIRLLNTHPKIYNMGDVFYLYRKNRTGAITRTISYKRLNDYLTLIRKFAYYNYNDDRFKDIMLNYIAYQYLIFVGYNRTFENKKERKLLKEEGKEFRKLLKYDLMPQTHLVNKISKFIGYNLTEKLLGIYLKKKKLGE